MNGVFCNLLLKIHIVVPMYHMFFFVSHYSWINMISKCVDFVKFCISFWKFIIISNHTKICLTILGFSFLYHVLQLCFICHIHYTPLTCGKKLQKFWDFEAYFEFFKIFNSIILNYESFISVNSSLLSFKFLIVIF
jgi:hypothetical protein